MCLLWAVNFRDPTVSLSRLPTLVGLSPLNCLNQSGSFTRGSIYPFLLLSDTSFFTISFNSATLLDFVQRYRAHSSITHCGVDLKCTLTPMKCDVPVHMQCSVPSHVNAIWTFYLIHLTMYHGQLYYMHIISKTTIRFNVNL